MCRDLAFQERFLQDAIARHTDLQALEMRAASQAATLASAPAPDPLHKPVPSSDFQGAGFTPDDLKKHPFFRETLAAAEAGDPDTLAPVEDAVEEDSDNETVLASLAVAFGGLYERAVELDAYLQHEVCLESHITTKMCYFCLFCFGCIRDAGFLLALLLQRCGGGQRQ